MGQHTAHRPERQPPALEAVPMGASQSRERQTVKPQNTAGSGPKWEYPLFDVLGPFSGPFGVGGIVTL